MIADEKLNAIEIALRRRAFGAHEGVVGDLLQAIAERDTTIKRIQSAAKMGMYAAHAIAWNDLQRAVKLNAESRPEAIEAERAANERLTNELERLQRHCDEAGGRIIGLGDQIASIARDLGCGHCAIDIIAAINLLRDSLSVAKSEAAEYRRENEELRKWVANIHAACKVEATHDASSDLLADDILEWISRATSQLAELRKPVLVEPDHEIDEIRQRAENRRDDFHFAWTVGANYLNADCDVHKMLRKYDALAQNAARDASARDAMAAEITGLRGRIANYEDCNNQNMLLFSEVAAERDILRQTADKRISGLEDECWRWRDRLLSAEERERQLREAAIQVRNWMIERMLCSTDECCEQLSAHINQINYALDAHHRAALSASPPPEESK